MFTTHNSSSKIPFHFVTASSHYSLSSFSLKLESELESISNSKKMLSNSPLIDPSGYIRPIECDKVVEIFDVMTDAFTEMSMQLKSMDRLQALSVPNYYKLQVKLYLASNKLLTLTELVSQIRSICMKKNPQQQRILARAQRELLEIERICEQIEAESKELLDCMLLNIS